MYVDLTDDQKKEYGRLYVSRVDWQNAQFCLSMLLRKGWHSKQTQRKRTVYQQQAAYTTAFVIAYARPFTHGNDWNILPVERYIADEAQIDCHRRIIAMRHTIFAHSDRKHFSVRPWRSGDFQTDIVRVPDLRIVPEDARVLEKMLAQFIGRIETELREIVPALPTNRWTEADLPFDQLEVGESFFLPI